MSAEAERHAAEQRSQREWFGNILTGRNMFAFTAQDLDAAKEARAEECDYVALRDRQRALLEEARPIAEALTKADTDELRARNPAALLEAGFRIKKKQYGLKRGTSDEANRAIVDAQKRAGRNRQTIFCAGSDAATIGRGPHV